MYDLIVVGAGPAGLSAACHAQRNRMKVLVIEKGEIANTIFDYQKGKHVMAEPAMIPLRSDVPFEPGTRETLLQRWNEIALASGVPIQRPEEVRAIIKPGESFTVTTNRGEYAATAVILAIGVQGNPRKLNAPGETLSHVYSKLADPSIYEDEDILMVGAGDAAIEGVLALCEKNRVTVVNRHSEFFRLKEALHGDVMQKVKMKRVTALHDAEVERIEEGYASIKIFEPISPMAKRDPNVPPKEVVTVKAKLVFVRIGADIPRLFLEGIGVRFASEKAEAPPLLTKYHETNIPGLFLIGAVAGSGLIKQGMNQGYDVVEHLLGREIEPVEEPIIRDERLRMLEGSTEARLKEIRSLVPFLADVSDASLRETVLAAKVHMDIKARTAIYREDHYSDSLFVILRGSVNVSRRIENGSESVTRLQRGDFFGEMSLVSGLRRLEKAKSIEDSILWEIPRRAILRLMNAAPSAKQAIDEHFTMRALHAYLLPEAQLTFLRSLALRATTCTYKQGQVVYKAGDPSDFLYLVRSGSMKVTDRSGVGGKEVVINHLPVGQCFGHAELIGMEKTPPLRQVTVAATKTSEVIRFKKKDFHAMLERYPALSDRLRQSLQEANVRNAEVYTREVGEDHLINKLVDSGVFEGTDVLLIDEDKCIRCDQCMTACASTHDGQTRLYRTVGNIFGNLLVPSSCRHCENPKCLTDCPPGDAILRHKDGQVYIDPVRCIGCGNCKQNCPYGNIFMVPPAKVEPAGPFDWLLGIIGSAKGSPPLDESGEKKAIKCDLCRGLDHGPACVRICPTGAAFRVSPTEYFKRIGVGTR